ncbi:hypothetical protein RT99_16180 [Flavobacterium sp. MEB061]|nr:hypothetical protein RT99_16180 [Flavobacterium sp. MEB061]
MATYAVKKVLSNAYIDGDFLIMPENGGKRISYISKKMDNLSPAGVSVSLVNAKSTKNKT